jgi:hypothetical protein
MTSQSLVHNADGESVPDFAVELFAVSTFVNPMSPSSKVVFAEVQNIWKTLAPVAREIVTVAVTAAGSTDLDRATV